MSMEGFTEVHLKAEREIIDRGLKPFRTHFCVHLLALRVPKHLRNKSIALCLERKEQLVAIPNPILVGPSAVDIQVNQDLDLYLTMAGREKVDAKILKAGEPVVDGEPLPEFETVMARLTFRSKDAWGAVLDCTSINLADFILGKHSTTKLELPLHLEGRLMVSVEARIVTSLSFAKSCHEIETINPPNDNGENRNRETQLVSGSSALKEASSSDTLRSYCDKAHSNATEASSLSKQPILRSGLGRNCGDLQAGLFSSCSVNSEHEIGTEEGINDKNKEYEQPGNQKVKEVNFRNVTSSWDFGKEYITQYSRGIWREKPHVSELDGPEKLIFWSIEGPDEDTSDEAEDTDEEGGLLPKRKHTSMTLSSSKPGPPARVGKLSPMQKRILTPKNPKSAVVIPLGAPIRLVRASALVASRYLVYEVKYVDEPLLSESEGESDDEDDDGEENEDEDDDDDDHIEDESEEENENSGDGQESDRSGTDEDDSAFKSIELEHSPKRENSSGSDKNSLSTKSLQTSLSNLNVVNRGCEKQSSCARSGEEDFLQKENAKEKQKGSISDAGDERIVELKFQILEMEKHIFQLREELRSVSSENDRLRSHIKGRKDENLAGTDLGKKFIEINGRCDEIKGGCLVDELRRQLKIERNKSIQCQLEHERLLEVILTLTSELDQQMDSGLLWNKMQGINSKLRTVHIEFGGENSHLDKNKKLDFEKTSQNNYRKRHKKVAKGSELTEPVREKSLTCSEDSERKPRGRQRKNGFLNLVRR